MVLLDGLGRDFLRLRGIRLLGNLTGVGKDLQRRDEVLQPHNGVGLHPI